MTTRDGAKLRATRHATQDKISKPELATFLRRLAHLYKSPSTGNRPLSVALLELAGTLDYGATRDLPFAPMQSLYSTRLESRKFRNMDAKAVEEFIADDLRTKAELIELGTLRFSIPRSNLMRMRISDVRAAIHAAVLHEQSIQVIGDEAIRSGADRKS
jgi:hypothetical protein